MVSYVLLVVIAIAVSVFVYAYLKLYLPQNQKECDPDVKIVVTDVECVVLPDGQLKVTLENRGLFKVSGVYFRFGEASKTVKKQLNNSFSTLKEPMFPGNASAFVFNNLNATFPGLNKQTQYEIEIEPVVLDKGFLVPCKNSIVTYPVRCIQQK